jgi:hypothetical protein
MNGRLHEVARKLMGAFRELGKLGVVARHNFLCCRSCAIAELNELILRKVASGKEVKGGVFYHMQDTDNFLEGADLPIRYFEATDDDDVRASSLPVEDLGDLVCEVLSRHDLAVEWNGNPDICIRVLVNEDRTSRFLQ